MNPPAAPQDASSGDVPVEGDETLSDAFELGDEILVLDNSDLDTPAEDSSEVVRRLGQVLKVATADKGPEVAEAIEAVSQMLIWEESRVHRGPLPAPEDLAAYEAASPGAAKEILAGAREARQHRIHMDEITANTARMSLVFAFLLVLVCITAATVLALNDKEGFAAVLGAAGIAPIIYALIRGGGDWTGRNGSDSD